MPLLCHHGRLLVLLVLLAATSNGNPTGDTYDPSKCQPQNYTCGGVSVRYPFYLSSATQVLPEYGESYCGYPGLAIICDGGTPILELDDDNYTVSHIDFTNRTISLVDTDVVARSCPIVDHNVTVLPATRLFFPTSTTAYLFFFINCTFGTEAGAVSMPSTIKPITCGASGEGPTSTMSFVLPEREVPPKDWWQGCQAVYKVPVLRDALPDDAQDPEWRKDGYVKALREGFQVAWGQISGKCSRCEQSNNGMCGYNRTGGFLGCVCANGLVDSDGCSNISDSTAPPSGGEKKRRKKWGEKKRRKKYVIASTLGILLLCLLFFAFLLGRKKYKSKKRSKETRRIESFLQKNWTLQPKRYTYAQVKRMTKSFAEKLGQGGYGAVYRGDLSNGRQIAVKMLKDSKADGEDEDFINEVASISKTSHVNVVTLIGFCLEGSKRALIYDYMPNGSLERYAFNENSKGENTLSWEKLFDIAVGIARGLEYLHQGCNTRIVHFDIKPHNILLDQDFCPKISDFGLAKLCLNKESAISIGCARGTMGYIAPEVYSEQFGAVSSKSDVYSYGMMVLEMVGARDKNIYANSESSRQYFPRWIYEHLEEYCVSSSEINGEITELVRKMIVVGLWCIQLIPTNRPAMTTVLEMLEGSTSGLELPPKVLLPFC